MKIFEGTLNTVSVQELLRWAESAEKTGSLTLCCEGITKTFFFQKGKLIFASSQKEGERTGEFFTGRCGLDRDTLHKAIKNSIQLNIPFTEYLISQQIVDKDTLTSWVKMFIETILSDTLHWKVGTFTFTGELPAAVMNGPVKVETSVAVIECPKGVHLEPKKEVAPAEVKQIFKQIGNSLVPLSRDTSSGIAIKSGLSISGIGSQKSLQEISGVSFLSNGSEHKTGQDTVCF